MFHEHRKPIKPKELQILQLLSPRKNFSYKEKQTFNNLMKGYNGEKQFYTLLKKHLSSSGIILSDLLLEINNSVFQIDNVLVRNKTIFQFEVKNYDGEFYIENGDWYIAGTRKEISNPLLQLKKSNYLLRQLLQKLGYNLQVRPYLVFINQEFTLYQLPLKLPIILPNQLNRFIKNLNNTPVNTHKYHTDIARDLVASNIKDSSYENLPEYDYHQLRKGMTCPKCYTFLIRYNKQHVKCENCGHIENIQSAILRSTCEFKLLFPNKKITTSVIFDWCELDLSKFTIRQVLSNHLKQIYKGRYTHYEFVNQQDKLRIL